MFLHGCDDLSKRAFFRLGLNTHRIAPGRELQFGTDFIDNGACYDGLRAFRKKQKTLSTNAFFNVGRKTYITKRSRPRAPIWYRIHRQWCKL